MLSISGRECGSAEGGSGSAGLEGQEFYVHSDGIPVLTAHFVL